LLLESFALETIVVAQNVINAGASEASSTLATIIVAVPGDKRRQLLPVWMRLKKHLR